MMLFLFVAGLAAMYGVVYYLNHKTPAPEGCEDLKAECDGCKISSCGNHPNHNERKDKQNG